MSQRNKKDSVQKLRGVRSVLLGVVYSISSLGDQQPPSRDGSSLRNPQLELPTHQRAGGAGPYTGFNSVDLQQIYVVEQKRATRTQIARGWGKPIVVRLADGELIASQYKDLRENRNPKYPEALEEAALFRSADGGESWSPAELLSIPGRVSQFSALKSQTLILAIEDPGKIYRSEDRGTTWTPTKITWGVPSEAGSRHRFILGETSGVVEMPDGTLLSSAYVSLGPGKSKAYVLRSNDDGKTWGDSSFVANASEISYVLLANSKLLGVARVANHETGEGEASLAITDSLDSGQSWTNLRGVGLGQAQIPGFPIYLRDGRLLLVFGNRQFPFGAQAIASRDDGKTWDLDHPILLSWFSWDHYCGHPRSLILPDGSLLTAYYTRVFNESRSPNRDIVSHLLRWRVPANWPPGS